MIDIQNWLFAMFHSRVYDADKSQILANVKEPSGSCRVVFWTIAFGMGVDIRTIIHYGPSTDVDDYIQEAGHAGMDCLPSNAILYCYPGCTLGHVSPVMKKYTTNSEKCRRLLLLKSFPGRHNTTQTNHHSCCDVCHVQLHVLINLSLLNKQDNNPVRVMGKLSFQYAFQRLNSFRI